MRLENRLLEKPVLVFHPRVWMRFSWLCLKCPTEISAFGVSAPGEPFRIVDLFVPKQLGSTAYTDMDMDDVLEHNKRLSREGLQPYQYNVVWMHTHPGNGATPSGVDWRTLRDDLSKTGEVKVMFILAKGGHHTAHVRFRNRWLTRDWNPFMGDWEKIREADQWEEVPMEVRIDWAAMSDDDVAYMNASEWTADLKKVKERSYVTSSTGKSAWIRDGDEDLWGWRSRVDRQSSFRRVWQQPNAHGVTPDEVAVGDVIVVGDVHYEVTDIGEDTQGFKTTFRCQRFCPDKLVYLGNQVCLVWPGEITAHVPMDCSDIFDPNIVLEEEEGGEVEAFGKEVLHD